MQAHVSYVLKVLFYLSLKEARRVSHAEYSDMRSRVERVGFKKKGKLINRLVSLYDSIVVGPVSAPAAPASPIEGDQSQARAAH